MNKLVQTIRTGDVNDAFEAAKRLAKVKPLPIRELMDAMKTGRTDANREAATYALGCIIGYDAKRRLGEVVTALSTRATDPDEVPTIRGQAFEGIGMCGLTKRHRIWEKTVDVVRQGLRDQDATVCFWACYAAGSSRMMELEEELLSLAQKDKRVCPHWWYIADEAADAAGKLHDRKPPDRVPVKVAGNAR